MKDLKEVVIGIVKGAKGLSGEVKVLPHVANLKRYDTVDSLVLELPSGKRLRVTLQYWYPYQKAVVMKFTEVSDRTMAEALKGAEMKVPVETSPRLPEGEYYFYQLIGLKVQTTQGMFIGILEDILQTGANDVYIVRGPAGEYLIPAVEKFVKEIDIEKGLMWVDPVEGLLEVYEKR